MQALQLWKRERYLELFDHDLATDSVKKKTTYYLVEYIILMVF